MEEREKNRFKGALVVSVILNVVSSQIQKAHPGEQCKSQYEAVN